MGATCRKERCFDSFYNLQIIPQKSVHEFLSLEVAQNYSEYECLVNITFKSNAVIQ